MPIYEFRCAQCGNIQEFLSTSSSQEIDIKCEQCQGEEMVRVMSAASYSMGSSGCGSGKESSSPSATTRNCGPGKSCTTLELPGHTR